MQHSSSEAERVGVGVAEQVQGGRALAGASILARLHGLLLPRLLGRRAAVGGARLGCGRLLQCIMFMLRAENCSDQYNVCAQRLCSLWCTLKPGACFPRRSCTGHALVRE